MTELRRYDFTIQRLLTFLWLNGFKSSETGKPAQGDLVKLQSAPDSEWHLSFYIENQNDGYHLLESLKTGKLMRWGNVGFVVLSREWVRDNERIRWTDEQFRFADLLRAESRRADFYINLPFIEKITKDRAVIGFRTRHSLDKVRTIGNAFDFNKFSRGDLRTYLYALERKHAEASRIEVDGKS